MRTLLLVGLSTLVPVSLVMAQATAPRTTASSPRTTPAAKEATTKATAEGWAQKHLEGWPPKTVALAVDLVRKYGEPNETSATRITWFHNGPWKRTVLFKEGTPHKFPKLHQDVLEQTVDYRVPPDKAGDLLKYNGSLVIDRTRGELSAHCDSEQQNNIVLNIADDIVKGERNVEQALAYHAQIIVGMRDGDPETYPLKLRFKPPAHDAPSADPGQEAPLLVHLGD